MKKLMFAALLTTIALSAFSQVYPENEPKAPLPIKLSDEPAPANASLLTRIKDNTLAAFLRHANEPLFTKGELDLDIAGTYSASEPDGFTHIMERNIRDGVWGVNVGGTYFMTRNFGSGVELGINDATKLGSLVFDYTTVTGTGRLPLGNFCPYLTVGVGTDFHTGGYNFQAGPGIEYRLTSHFGVFTEARYVWKDGPDTLMGRFGLRFAFR